MMKIPVSEKKRAEWLRMVHKCNREHVCTPSASEFFGLKKYIATIEPKVEVQKKLDEV